MDYMMLHVYMQYFCIYTHTGNLGWGGGGGGKGGGGFSTGDTFEYFCTIEPLIKDQAYVTISLLLLVNEGLHWLQKKLWPSPCATVNIINNEANWFQTQPGYSFFCMKAGRFSSPRMAVRSSLSCWKSRFSKILNLGFSRTGGKRGYQETLQELHHNMHPATFQVTTAECNTMAGFTTAKCNTMVGFTFFNPQSLVNSKMQSSPDCKTIFSLIAL